MEFRQLQHLLAVVESHSFTKAAVKLHTAQSTLSTSVRNLEHELGVSLLDRSGPRLELTQAGAAFAPEARLILRAMDHARDAVAATEDLVRGTLRIGVMQSLVTHGAGSLLREYHQRYPQVGIELQSLHGGSRAMVEQVRNGGLDVALAWVADQCPAGVDAVVVATSPMVLIAQMSCELASRGNLALGDLTDLSFIEFPDGWASRTASDLAFARAGVHRRIAVEVTHSSLCVELVRAGLGVAVVPEALIASADRSLVQALPGLPTWGVAVITPVARRPTAATRAFAELTGQCAKHVEQEFFSFSAG